MKLNLFFFIANTLNHSLQINSQMWNCWESIWTLSEEAVRLLTYSPEIRYQLVSLYIHKHGCYIFVLIDISLSPKSTITFQGHFPGGTTAPGSPPPTSAHSGPPALTSQIKLPMVGSEPITPPQDISSTKLFPLTSPSFISTSRLPWGDSGVVRVEHENICCTPGSWFSWMLCRCLVLH